MSMYGRHIPGHKIEIISIKDLYLIFLKQCYEEDSKKSMLVYFSLESQAVCAKDEN